ncbi:uncharacterized protein K452DRAFT_200416, partial [Aplosporella prunicola CBS 121167]
QQIRTITLYPGLWDETPCCDIGLALLDQSPKYKALSYVWGSAKVLRPISLDGREYFVTANLAYALRRLRQRHSPRPVTLWIDALCINQSDNTERSCQVSLMRDIYMGAEEAYVYIG